VLTDAQATLVSRDEKIRNLMDEVKALREIVAKSTSNSPTAKADEWLVNPPNTAYPLLKLPELVSSSSATENLIVPSVSTSTNNPLLAEKNAEEKVPQEPLKTIAEFSENDSVDRSVSNVLSLAERVRNLKTGVK
jgi:hypothetical protein